MAFYKPVKRTATGLWYPQAVSPAGAADTDEVARRLSELSTVSRADVYAVLMNLPEVLSFILSNGRSVRLDGLGTFYYTIDTQGNGVPTRAEVGPAQINAVHVRFIPEYSRTQRGGIRERSLVPQDIEWTEYGKTYEEEQP